MNNGRPTGSGRRGFPKVDRSVIVVGSVFEEDDEKAFWLAKTPLERLEVLELYREIAFGYDPSTARLQRVLESAEFPPQGSRSSEASVS